MIWWRVLSRGECRRCSRSCRRRSRCRRLQAFLRDREASHQQPPLAPSAKQPAAVAASSPNHRGTWRQWRGRVRLPLRILRSDRKPHTGARLFAAGAPCWLPFFRARSFLVASISLLSFAFSNLAAHLSQRLANRGLQGRKSSPYLFAQMHTQRAPATFRKNREIPACLRGLNHTERVFLFGHGKVIGVLACNLQEDATVRPTFVSLSCRVQEPGTKSQNCRYSLCVPDSVTNDLQSSFILRVHRDIAQESEVVSLACPLEMSFQDLGKCLSALEILCVSLVRVQLDTIALKEWGLGRQLARGFVFARKFTSRNFAGFDVGLVEGVDTDD